MKSLKTMIVTAVLGFVLVAAPAFAQGTQPPTTPPTTPPAAQQPPATPPAVPAPQKPAVPLPFPEGAKMAFVDIQAIAATSAEGKAATARIQEAEKKITANLQEKGKALQALQAKMQQGANVLSPQALAQLEKDIEKQNRELQFAQQDAQTEATDLRNQVQAEFQEKLNPVIEDVRKEKGLHIIFSIRDSGIAAADMGLDITGDVIKKFDAAAKTAPPKK
jgi:Skp family chaperone for outer membrane proteins